MVIRGILAAAVLAAAFLLLALPLPPRATPLAPLDPESTRSPNMPPVVSGVLHVHTKQSDGSGSIEEVADAAARAGLQFIVLTDHGDGTRPPRPPRYISGVLVIDAVELSTQSGHYIAIGLPATPYPLRGDARDVVEDVRRLGGFGIVAHPDSAKPALRWSDWDVPVDAIEWLNADTEWRDEGMPHLARALARYPFRPSATLASLLDRPDETLARWDRLTQRRPVIALAGADAHARAGWGDDDVNGYRRGWFVRMPSYLASLSTFSVRVLTPYGIPSDDPVAAAGEIVAALRAGHVYTAIDAVAAPPYFEFMLIENDRMTAQMGDLALNPGTFVVRSNAPANATTVLRKNGAIVQTQTASALKFVATESGTYRAEVIVAGAPGDPPAPWVMSNPIYVRNDEWGSTWSSVRPAPTNVRNIQGGPWHVEKNDGSTASVAQSGYPTGPVTFTYQLAAGERSGQYAALGISVGRALGDADRIALQAHASRPMRVSVQARHPQTGGRWQRSIYVDSTWRDFVVPFNEFRAIGSSGPFDPSSSDTLLFVVDTVNTLPGTSGSVTIANLRVGRSG